MRLTDFLVSDMASILDVLKKINSSSGGNAYILFVKDINDRIIGSISDGDCRRALIRGKKLDTSVCDVMNADFTFLEHGNFDIEKISLIRKKNLKYVPEIYSDKRLYAIRDFTDGKSYIPVDAVLMAGGQGKRLQPLTLSTPKPLLKVADKAIIDYNIDNVIKYGIDNINVTVNYLHEQIEEHFSKPIDGFRVNCIKEGKYLGTIGSLRLISNWKYDTILVMNSDLFTNINFEAFYVHFKKHNADMSVAAVPYNVNIPYGIFEINNTREIKGIKEKPNYYYYANAGIYLIKRELLSYIPNDAFYDATDFILRLIQLNKKVIRYPITGYWIDIGKPEDFKNVQEFARNIRAN